MFGGVNGERPVRQDSLTPNDWAYLCGFLQMDLQAVLKLTNRELLRATDAEIARRAKKSLTSRILSGKSTS